MYVLWSVFVQPVSRLAACDRGLTGLDDARSYILSLPADAPGKTNSHNKIEEAYHAIRQTRSCIVNEHTYQTRIGQIRARAKAGRAKAASIRAMKAASKANPSAAKAHPHTPKARTIAAKTNKGRAMGRPVVKAAPMKTAPPPPPTRSSGSGSRFAFEFVRSPGLLPPKAAPPALALPAPAPLLALPAPMLALPAPPAHPAQAPVLPLALENLQVGV